MVVADLAGYTNLFVEQELLGLVAEFFPVIRKDDESEGVVGISAAEVDERRCVFGVFQVAGTEYLIAHGSFFAQVLGGFGGGDGGLCMHGRQQQQACGQEEEVFHIKCFDAKLRERSRMALLSWGNAVPCQFFAYRYLYYICHPFYSGNGCVAQLNRASDYGSEGFRFES